MLNDYLSRLSFRRRIRSGYIILFTLVCIIVTISFIQMNRIKENTVLLYEHPFAVSNAISDINARINEIQSLIKEIILNKDLIETKEYIAKINENEKIIDQAYNTISLYFLGDKKIVTRAEKKFSEWRTMNKIVIDLYSSGNIKQVFLLLTSDISKKVSEIIECNRPIKTFALGKAKILINNVYREEKRSLIIITCLTLFLLVLGAAILVFVERSVSLPIRQFTRKAKELLKIELKEDSRKVTEQELLDLTLAEVKKHQDELEGLVHDRTSELIITIDKLERSNKELEQFAYVASHDLQEPLRMISSFTQLLQRRYKDKLDKDAIEFIRFAVEGANRMQKLINDLLEFSRISVQGDHFTRVDTQELLGHVISNLHQLITANTAIITNEDLPVVDGNESQLLQLFQNLVENAVKFRKTTEIPVIHISCEEKEDVYEFAFKDNGIGIDMQYHDRVFVIFQRLHSKEKYSGTGIGLPICKRIVERHGGNIWFESIVNEGTIFKFTINK